MQRISYLITAFLTVSAILSSCSKETGNAPADECVKAGESLTITAGMDTKTYYNEGKVKWTSSDMLKVFNADNAGSIFNIKNGGGQLTATFSCDNWVGGTPVIALHANGTELNNCVCTGTDTKTITGYLNPTQSILHKGSFAKEAALAVGTVSGSAGSYQISEMKNAFAVISFRVEGSDIKKITLTGNNDENLAGWVNVNYNDGEPTWTPSGIAGKETSKSIVVTVKGSGGQTADATLFNPGSLYQITVLPQTLSKGFTMEIEKSNGAKAKRVITSSIALTRSEYRALSKAVDNNLAFNLTVDCTTIAGGTFKYNNNGTISNLPARGTRTAAGTDFWAASYPSYKFNGAVSYWYVNFGVLNMSKDSYIRFPRIDGFKLTSIEDIKVLHSGSRKYKITAATAASYAGGTAVAGGGEKTLNSALAPVSFFLTDTYDSTRDYYIVCDQEGGFVFKLNYTSQPTQQ